MGGGLGGGGEGARSHGVRNHTCVCACSNHNTLTRSAGKIKLDEVLHAQTKPAVQAFLQESRQKTFRRLFDVNNVEKTTTAFQHIDKDGSGDIDVKEVITS